jgi:hypothetical protein
MYAFDDSEQAVCEKQNCNSHRYPRQFDQSMEDQIIPKTRQGEQCQNDDAENDLKDAVK